MDQSSSTEANDHYKSGMDLKAKGHTDAALTSFRRAAILEPNFFGAQLEIGYLCREKAKRDRTFLRYAFEAFRTAARLDLKHEEAHNQYIMAGQQMGLLDNLHQEYSDWVRQYPDNELMQRCNKNIVALSMAMMPQQVSVSGSPMGGSFRKILLITSVIALGASLLAFIAPPLLLKSGKIKQENVRGFLRLGFVLGGVGALGFVIRSRIE